MKPRVIGGEYYLKFLNGGGAYINIIWGGNHDDRRIFTGPMSNIEVFNDHILQGGISAYSVFYPGGKKGTDYFWAKREEVFMGEHHRGERIRVFGEHREYPKFLCRGVSGNTCTGNQTRFFKQGDLKSPADVLEFIHISHSRGSGHKKPGVTIRGEKSFGPLII